MQESIREELHAYMLTVSGATLVAEPSNRLPCQVDTGNQGINIARLVRHGRRQKLADVTVRDMAMGERRRAVIVVEPIDAVAAVARRRRHAGVGEEGRARRHEALGQRRPALGRIRRRWCQRRREKGVAEVHEYWDERNQAAGEVWRQERFQLNLMCCICRGRGRRRRDRMGLLVRRFTSSFGLDRGTRLRHNHGEDDEQGDHDALALVGGRHGNEALFVWLRCVYGV
jgi:hypothetical protein